MIQSINRFSLCSFAIALFLIFFNNITVAKDTKYLILFNELANLFFAIGLLGILSQIQKMNKKFQSIKTKKHKIDFLAYFVYFFFFFLFPEFSALIIGILFSNQYQSCVTNSKNKEQ